MINPLFDFFEKLITQFTWRRLIFIVTIFFISFGSLIMYETYTSHFRLNRIKHSTNLLKELTTLSPEIQKSNNKNISKIFKGLTNDLNVYINHKITPFDIPTWILKMLAATAPWIIFSILIILVDSSDIKNAIIGTLIVAIPSVFIGALLPDFKYPAINYIVYPVSISIILITLVMLWNKFKKS